MFDNDDLNFKSFEEPIKIFDCIVLAHIIAVKFVKIVPSAKLI